jgi:serine/threonine-protein kinase HipA
MTPIYDVISAQPSLDSGQIRHGKMKLAMAVGKNRHYAVDSVVPRHFFQTAERAGIGNSTVSAIFTSIRAMAPKAIESVRQSLPTDFPKAVATSIIRGLQNRLRRIDG